MPKKSSRSPQKKQAPGVQGVTQVSFDDTGRTVARCDPPSGPTMSANSPMRIVIRTVPTSNHDKAAGGDRGRGVEQHGPVSAVTRSDWESELATRIGERENAVWNGGRNGPKQISSHVWEGTCAACGCEHRMETDRVTRVYKDESLCYGCKKYARRMMDQELMQLTNSDSPVCFGFYILFGSIVHTQHDSKNRESHPDFSICGHLGNGSLYGNFVMNCKVVEDAHRTIESQRSLIWYLEHHPEDLVKGIRHQISEGEITGEMLDASFNPVDREGIRERMEAFLPHEKSVWDKVDQRGYSIWKQAKSKKAKAKSKKAKAKAKAAGGKNDS